MMPASFRNLVLTTLIETWRRRFEAWQPPPWLHRLTVIRGGMLSAEQFAVLGGLLLIVVYIAVKLRWSPVIIALGAIAAVLCLATGGVMSFLAPEAARTEIIIADKAHHKGDVGAGCATSSDCIHGSICVTLYHRRQCLRPCGLADHCRAPLRCQRSREGRHVCVQ